MSSSETTTDHETIKSWVESRGGRPSVAPTAGGRGRKKSGGVLRFDFGPKEEGLEETSWDDFFKIFDESGLAFLFQDKTKDGKPSRFNRFIRKEGEAGDQKGRVETKASLMEKAKAKNVPGRSKMTKAELEKAVA